MRRLALATVFAASCAAARPPTIEIPAPPSAIPALEDVARPSLTARVPLLERHQTRIRSSGITLYEDGGVLRAIVNVSDSQGERTIEKPEVSFSLFENGKWRPIRNCQAVPECDISRFGGSFRIRARYSARGAEPVTGEFSP